MASKFDLIRGFISSRKYKSNIYCDQADSLKKPLKMWSSLYLNTCISSLVVMIDQIRKQCHLWVKAICGLKGSNCGKYLVFLVTVLFIREEWLRLLTLLKTGLLGQTSSKKSLHISKNTCQNYDISG